MRIAVSGTHCCGKTTLVEDFVAAHPDYIHEPEPYEWLVELGEEPPEEPGVGDFHRQLEVSVERLSSYGRGTRVIAERSPVDFIAYMLALRDLGRAHLDAGLIEPALELAAAGMASVDLLVVLPLNDTDGIVAPESESLDLRDAMNARLLDITAGNELELIGVQTRVVEIFGTREHRLAALLRALAGSG